MCDCKVKGGNVRIVCGNLVCMDMINFVGLLYDVGMRVDVEGWWEWEWK